MTRLTDFSAVVMGGMVLLAVIPLTAEANLIGYWTFDEQSGMTALDSAGENHGSIIGAQRADGILGGALNLDGMDDCVTLPDNTPVWLPEYDFTYAAWVYFNAPAAVLSNEVLLDLNLTASSDPANDNGCGLIRKNDGTLFFGLTTISSTDEKLYSDQLLEEGVWYHIAAVREGTTQALYINGSIDNSRICSGGRIDFAGGSYDDDGVSIGRITTTNNPDGVFFLDGIMDDVRIYDVALSSAQIRELAIPEPTTLLLLGLSTAGWWVRRRR